MNDATLNTLGASPAMTAATKRMTVRCTRAAFVVLPILLVATHSLQLVGPLNTALQVLGVIGLLAIPGYTLLWAVRQDPLAGGKHTYRWALVVPLSLSVDALVGIVLVMTPISLTRFSLWAGLGIWAALTSVVGVLRS